MPTPAADEFERAHPSHPREYTVRSSGTRPVPPRHRPLTAVDAAAGREPQVERVAIVADEFVEQRRRRTPLEGRAAVQFKHVHAFDDSVARVAVK